MILKMGEKAAFIFGKQGCLTDMELHTTLKVKTLGDSQSDCDFWLINEDKHILGP